MLAGSKLAQSKPETMVNDYKPRSVLREANWLVLSNVAVLGLVYSWVSTQAESNERLAPRVRGDYAFTPDLCLC